MDLNHIMQFDHVIQITEDGEVIERSDIYAPDFRNDEIMNEAWEQFSYGYTGQYGVATPMHDSEFIGGRLERDILSTPGIYVSLVCYWDADPDGEPYGDADDNIEGWCVARLKDGPN